MNETYKKIKATYGESVARFIRDTCPTLLECDANDVKASIRGCYKHLSPEVCKYIASRFKPEVGDVIKVEKQDMLALLDKAGYNAYVAKSKTEQDKIKKYFAPDEMLCSFKENRTNSHFIINAVKKNVDEIKRSSSPERQDEYGTSVISIQITKSTGVVSIKNRYNHTVNNPDATFGNRLDNIIDGLKDAVEQHFSVKVNAGDSGIPEGFYIVGNTLLRGTESNNVIIAPEYNAYGIHGAKEIHFMDKSRYVMFEKYMIDIKERTCINLSTNGEDGTSAAIQEELKASQRVVITNTGIKDNPGDFVIEVLE